MQTIKSMLLSQKFDVICRSMDFTICYKNGLSKNIKVLSHSPSILLNKNINQKIYIKSGQRKIN